MFCTIKVPNENNKILKINQGEKSREATFKIFTNLKWLIVKQIQYIINKKTGYWLFTQCSWHGSKSKLDYFRVEDCMEITS